VISPCSGGFIAAFGGISPRTFENVQAEKNRRGAGFF
jgi:hypothetical protein